MNWYSTANKFAGYPIKSMDPKPLLIARRLLNKKREFLFNPQAKCLITGDESSVDCARYLSFGGWTVHNHPSAAIPVPSVDDLAICRQYAQTRMDIVGATSVMIMENESGEWPHSIGRRESMGQWLKENGVKVSYQTIQEYEFTKPYFEWRREENKKKHEEGRRAYEHSVQQNAIRQQQEEEVERNRTDFLQEDNQFVMYPPPKKAMNNWWKIAQTYDDINPKDFDDPQMLNAERYFSIGQNDEDTKSTCWAFINGRLYKKKGGTHAMNFGTDSRYGWRGWYDPSQNIMSIVVPNDPEHGTVAVEKTVSDVPSDIIRELKKNFRRKDMRIIVF